MAAAHAHHIVHRDVTPGNILLGRAGAIKLGDFGVAEIQSLAESKAGRVFGTPGFIPPEACIGEGFGARGDVFSLGVVLYLCLTGHYPFSAHTVTQVLARTVACEIIAPRNLDATIPQGLEKIVLRLLARGPSERPDAEQAAGELEAFAASTGAVWKLASAVGADEPLAPKPVPDPARQWMQTLGGPTRPA
jgi:serine/threonine-protein kinase